MLSNDVGGDLMATPLARHTVADLLDVVEPVLRPIQVVSWSVDGFSAGTAKPPCLRDGRDALLAVGDERRAVAGRSWLSGTDGGAGLYWYVSAMSEVAGEARADEVRGFRAYWVPARRGAAGSIKTSSH
jgi:hypothetical protein